MHAVIYEKKTVSLKSRVRAVSVKSTDKQKSRNVLRVDGE
jgi:hypothetical protein